LPSSLSAVEAGLQSPKSKGLNKLDTFLGSRHTRSKLKHTHTCIYNIVGIVFTKRGGTDASISRWEKSDIRLDCCRVCRYRLGTGGVSAISDFNRDRFSCNSTCVH